MRRTPPAYLAALLLVAASNGCAGTPQYWVEAGSKRFSVELATTAPARERGLMFRDQMEAGHGMLFLFDSDQPLAFWMKNTKIALDIVYLDSRRRVVSIQAGVPPCSAGDRCPAYPASAPAMYVLELNAGNAEVLGLKIGDPVRFAPSIPPRGEP